MENSDLNFLYLSFHKLSKDLKMLLINVVFKNVIYKCVLCVVFEAGQGQFIFLTVVQISNTQLHL